jgi:CRP/FNR family transcriptional regulator, cyclic AMP receptor protein
MWTEPSSSASQMQSEFRKTLQRLSCAGRMIKISKNNNVYASGESDETVYILESGQIKLTVPSPEGKECLMAIRTAGDMFGELALSGHTIRFETAVAMKDTVVRQIFHRNFLAYLKRESLLEGLIQYLAARIAEQQDLITSMTTLNSERRLARILLHLSGILGRNQSCGTCIPQHISQNELAKMVGTTRTRIGIFLKRFRENGMLHMTLDHCLVLEQNKLNEFLIGGDLSSMQCDDFGETPEGQEEPHAHSLTTCGKSCIPTRIRI